VSEQKSPDRPARNRRGLTFGRLLAGLAAGWVALFQGQRVVESFLNGFYSTDLPAYLVGFQLAKVRGPLYNLTNQNLLLGVIRDNPKLAPCPFNYPPHLAAAGAWLPSLRYSEVLYPALILNSVLALVSAFVSWRWLRGRLSDIKGGATLWLAALCVVSLPATWLAISVGSITPVVLIGSVAVCGGVLNPTKWRGWLLPFGFLALAIKPQFAVIVAIAAAVVITKRQLVQTIGLGSVVVAGCTWWFGVGIWNDYLQLLQTFSTAGANLCRLTGAMINTVGTAKRFGFELEGTLMWLVFSIGFFGSVGFGWLARRASPEYKLIAVGGSMALALLVSPHSNPQDTLLALPLLAGLWVVGSSRVRFALLATTFLVAAGSYESMWALMPFVLLAGIMGAVITLRAVETRPESVHLESPVLITIR
jgi:hypothetical protein